MSKGRHPQKEKHHARRAKPPTRRDRKRARKSLGQAKAAPAAPVGQETLYRCLFFGFRETELRRALSRVAWRMEQPRQRVEVASRVPIGTASRPR